MRADDDDIALIVQAYAFELLNSLGQVLARLGGSAAAAWPLVAGVSLDLLHRNVSTTDSQLAWNQPLAGARSEVSLRGPIWPTSPRPSFVSMAYEPALPLAELRTAVGDPVNGSAVQSVDRLDRTTSTDAQSTVNVNASGTAQVQQTATRPGSLASLITIAGPGDCRADMSAIGTAGVAGVTADGNTGLVSLLSPNVGGSGARLLCPSTANAVAALPGNVAALGDCATLTGARFIRQGNDLGIDPADAGGIVRVNTRQAWLPVAFGQFATLSTSTPGFRSFILNGISWNGQNDDWIEVTTSLRVACFVAGGAFVVECQPFSPAGSFVTGERGIAAGWAAGTDDTITCTWLFRAGAGAGFGGTGGYTATIVGGATGGSWGLTAPDCWMTVKVYAAR